MNLGDNGMITALMEVNHVLISHIYTPVAKSEMKLSFFSVQTYALLTAPIDFHTFPYSPLLKERD